MVEVVAGLIKINNKYLIAKRTYGDPGAQNKWEFPGGKIENYETDTEALIREAHEELGIEIKVIKYLCDYIQEYELRTIHLKLYLCSIISGNININSEHSKYALVDFVDIKNYDLAPADESLYKKIAKDML